MIEFKTTREDLSKALARASRFATGHTMPVLNHARITQSASWSGLMLTVTDLDTWLTVRVKARLICWGDGPADATLLPVKTLKALLNKLAPNTELHVTAGDSVCKVDAGPLGVFELTNFPAEEFPLTREAPIRVGKKPTEVHAEPLWDAFRRVSHAISDDDSRPVLCGVYLERIDSTLSLTATDGGRMYQVDLPADGTLPHVILRANACDFLAREKGGDTAMIDSDEKGEWVEIMSENFTLRTRTIDGPYPNYKQVLPKAFGVRARVSANVLVRALKPYLALADQGMPPLVKVSIDHEVGTLKLNGNSNIPAELAYGQGKRGDVIQFNAAYLFEAIQASVEAGVNTIDCFFSEATSAAVIQPVGGDRFALVMPTRIEN